MYKYSKGINLVAGGEKHRVYVKKSSNGKGAKGHVMVNHPTTDKGKWDTIDLTEKAGAKTVEEGKAATRKWHRENPYVSGAKSVKQYRGDENLPEAKNGMKKGCGCKHSKSKYKYQDGTKETSSQESSIPVNDRRKKIMQLLKDNLLLNQYSNSYSNLSDEEDEEYTEPVVKKQPFKETVDKKPKVVKKATGVHHTPSKFFRFAEGSSELTIPEGSAIVTANGGKNKQALMAYKKGNYKLLNRIIDKMPEDNVDKAQDGKKVTKVKGKYTTTDPTTKEVYQEQSVLGGGGGYGKEMPLDKAQNLYNLSDEEFEKIYGKNKKSDTYRIERGRREAVKKGNVTYNVAGKVNSKGELMDYASGYRSKPGVDEKPQDVPADVSKEIPTEIPTSTTPSDKKKISTKKGFDFPSLAEVAARASILGQGVENVPENYLKLDRYNYASQLPKTLQEIQLAEQAGRESTRDIVGGDAGRYLAQAGNLSAARMKAANDAVVQDTLARQDILNKNVDLSNVELQTNRSLKDQYAMQKSANRGAYNNQLIALGQGVDTAVDASKLMSSQKQNDAQRLEMLKTMAESGNYKVITNPDGTTTYAPKAKGSKKLKTYKRK